MKSNSNRPRPGSVVQRSVKLDKRISKSQNRRGRKCLEIATPPGRRHAFPLYPSALAKSKDVQFSDDRMLRITRNEFAALCTIVPKSKPTNSRHQKIYCTVSRRSTLVIGTECSSFRSEFAHLPRAFSTKTMGWRFCCSMVFTY